MHCLPGWPIFFIAAPITLFDNPMKSFVNCSSRKLPPIKTKLSDAVFNSSIAAKGNVCQKRKSREM